MASHMQGNSGGGSRAPAKGRSTQNKQTHNKDQLKSDSSRNLSDSNLANKDNFGSSHNRDLKTRMNKAPKAQQNLSAREREQDVRTPKSRNNLAKAAAAATAKRGK